MRQFCFAILFLCGFLALAAPALASDREPVAHIVEIDLQGEDVVNGTVIVREGTELKPTIWMPLYDRDIVFVRDPKSRVLIDYGTGGRAEVGQARMRLEISAETAHGGDNWGIISALGELLSGEEGEQVPTNLVSKGDDGTLSVPIANRTPNYVLRSGLPVWIEWSGGAEPFTVTLEADGKILPLAETKDRLVSFNLPEDGGQRIVLKIVDAMKRSVRVSLRVKDATPSAPTDLASDTTSPELLPALTAAWLARQDDGAWRIEAARLLRNSQDSNAALKRIGDALFAGWRPD
jgi:hypothetical protein